MWNKVVDRLTVIAIYTALPLAWLKRRCGTSHPTGDTDMNALYAHSETLTLRDLCGCSSQVHNVQKEGGLCDYRVEM